MSNEDTSIHDFDFGLICEYFSNIERQGPGSPEATLKALSFIDNLNNESSIIDIGCGTGGQTMVLAHNAPGNFKGLDMFPKFIDLFNANAKMNNLQERVKGIVGTMMELPFNDEEFDLIWSEGAIYNIGFEKGLNYWNRFLKRGGYIAVTEACWFTETRPEEINSFWNDAYPEIDTISNKMDQLQKAGYVPIASFILSENCWIENFYEPQSNIQEEFLKKHPGNENAENLVEEMKHEVKMYNKYKEFYGYVFFIGRKI
ncbi:MAG: methyltransferase domain-containing protein [Ignavibacteriales bacterium]|nr:methyltransferase domain-containing protein [Ignavibacteriales bacterium]